MEQEGRGESAARGLTGQRVTITGRLASMSREEAVERIAAAGGAFEATPSAGTDLLVVGQGGPPLDGEGRPTRSLRRARDLREGGAALAIVPEDELLARLGLAERRDDLQRLFTTEQLSRILEVPIAEVRSWLRHELIRPARVVRRLCFFDFGQVATAKALSQLTRDGVTPARIRRSLEELGAWLPDARRALAQLEALEKGGPLLVRTSEGRLAETSGQLRLEFGGETAAEAPTVAGGPANPPPAPRIDRTREEWFERGVAAEEAGHYEQAVEAYETTLSLGRTAEALFNLGNVLYAQGRKAEAAKRFLQATEIERDYVEAWNNLGNVLIEIELPAEAVQAYRRALSIEPDYADAHFNLAELLASRGELSEARRHWEAYLRQDPHSPWAREVRERLRRISDSVPRI